MKVTWILPDGARVSADVAEGQTLMQAAVDAEVPDIPGICGGCLSCATCHVVVPDAWLDRVGAPGEMENLMLDVTEAARQPNSRLSCQIEARADLDGLELIVPAP